MNSLKKILVIAALWVLLGVFAHAGTLTYIYTDPLGTPLAEADTSGNITATFDYRPYGSLALGAQPNGPGYAGHVNDPDSGFIYMQARFYDADAGRFLSADPINISAGNVLTFNRYTYADNNPINKSDPTGMCPDKNPCFEATPPNYFTDTIDGRFFGHLIGDSVAVLSKDNYNPLTNQFLDRGQIQEAKINMLGLAIPFLRAEGAVLQEVKMAGSIRGVNAIGGMENCVYCAIATDSTLAGRPMSALGGGPYPIAIIEKTFGVKFGAPTSIQSISQVMSDAGPGARGIIYGSRGEGQVGHVFNVVNQEGNIRFLDGQSGKAAVTQGYEDYQLLRTN